MELCAASESICGFWGPGAGSFAVGFEEALGPIVFGRLRANVGTEMGLWPIAGFVPLPLLGSVTLNDLETVMLEGLETVMLSGAVRVFPTLAVMLLVPGVKAVIVVVWPVWVTETIDGLLVLQAAPASAAGGAA